MELIVHQLDEPPHGPSTRAFCLSKACAPNRVLCDPVELPRVAERISIVCCDRQAYTDGKGHYLHAWIGTCGECGTHTVMVLDRREWESRPWIGILRR